MPFSGGTSGAHGDAMHQDDAKRDVAGGLAGLGALGELLAPGSDLELVRDGSDHIELIERTSGEIVARWTRVGVNDYTQWLHVGAVPTEILNDAMKDVANGIAGLDASVEIPLALLKVDVANGIAGLDASVEIPMALLKMDVANGIAGLDANARLVAGQYGVGENRSYHRTKVASANLRNSHDAAVDLTNTVNAVKKTFTFTNGIAGVLRAKMTLYNEVGGETTTGRWYKNGVAFGVVQTESGVMTSTEFSEDLPGMVMQPGDTLEVWAFGTTGVPADHTLSNCRLYYDKESHTGEAAVNS